MASIVGMETSISRPLVKVASLASAVGTIIAAAAGNPYAIYEWVTYIICGVSGLWSLILAIVLFAKRRPHPGILLALDLVFTIVTWLFGITAAIYITENWPLEHADEALRRAVALAACLILTGFFHFVAFVLACVDVHVRRTWTKNPEVDMAF